MYRVIKTTLIFLVLFPGLYYMAEAQTQTYLALGDSYTIGEKVEQHDRWPVILTGRLNELGYTYKEPEIVAVTGWTTGEHQKGMNNAEFEPPYDLVSLQIGVNNQYRGYGIEIFKKEFEELLSRAIILAGNRRDRVLVLSIPDYGVTPFAKDKDPEKISDEIDRYNHIKKSISERKGVIFVDITPISRMAADNRDLLAGDQIHPSGRMYKMWVDKILTRLLSETENWKISNR